MPVRVYLSPHPDDAALSCGGMMHAQAACGERVIAVTLFAGSPPGPVDLPEVGALHARWGAGADPPARRRQEDLSAMRRLGAEAVHLGHPDCIYRLGPDGAPLYPSDAAIFGDPDPRDPATPEALAEDVVRHVAEYGVVSVFAPLAAGHHVDHQIAHVVAHRLQARGLDVAFYEDYPYAERPGAVQAALGTRAGWSSQLLPLESMDVSAKVEAVACYRSQLSSFWRDPEEMEQRVRAYAAAVGGGAPAERLWRPAPAGAT